MKRYDIFIGNFDFFVVDFSMISTYTDDDGINVIINFFLGTILSLGFSFCLLLSKNNRYYLRFEGYYLLFEDLLVFCFSLLTTKKSLLNENCGAHLWVKLVNMFVCVSCMSMFFWISIQIIIWLLFQCFRVTHHHGLYLPYLYLNKQTHTIRVLCPRFYLMFFFEWMNEMKWWWWWPRIIMWYFLYFAFLLFFSLSICFIWSFTTGSSCLQKKVNLFFWRERKERIRMWTRFFCCIIIIWIENSVNLLIFLVSLLSFFVWHGLVLSKKK